MITQLDGVSWKGNGINRTVILFFISTLISSGDDIFFIIIRISFLKLLLIQLLITKSLNLLFFWLRRVPYPSKSYSFNFKSSILLTVCHCIVEYLHFFSFSFYWNRRVSYLLVAYSTLPFFWLRRVTYHSLAYSFKS